MQALEGGRIDAKHVLILLVLTRIVTMVITSPEISNTNVNQDAWIAGILGMLLAIPFALFLVHLGHMFPGMTIIEYSQVILGRWGGRVVGLIVIYFFIQQSANTARAFGDSFVIAVMPETPLLVFIIALVFLAGNTARNGLEVVARVGGPSLFVTLVLLGILFILPYNEMRFDNLLPVLARGLQPLWDAVILSVAFYGEFLVLTMVLPYLNRPKKVGRFTVYAIVLSGLMFTWLSIELAAVFGPTMASLVQPVFSLSRMINIAQFLERIEVISMGAWTLSTGVKLALFYWAAALGLAQWFNLSDYKPLVYPLGAIIVAFSILFYESTFDFAETFVAERFGVATILITVGIPLLLYTVARIRGLSPNARERS